MRDYVYAADLAEALVAVAEVETSRKVLNIGSGQGTSLNELVALMADVTGERPEVEYRSGRPLDVPANVLDMRRAREELGWASRTKLPDSIAYTWSWIRALSEKSVGQEARS